MDAKEVLLNLKLIHENQKKRNYKNARIQVGILIKCLEDEAEH